VQVNLSTILPIPVETAWDLVQTTALLEHVSAPLLRFVPIEPRALPSVWSECAYHVRVLLFGAIPMGEQWIDVSRLAAGPDSFQLRDNGWGSLARRWDHLITIDPVGPGTCRYTDRVDIAAGVLTPLIWAFAQLLYRHRQRRWRVLAADRKLELA
jgi:hypothetical protein